MGEARKHSLRSVRGAAKPEPRLEYHTFAHRWYQRRLLRESNGLALLGFLNILLRYARAVPGPDGGVCLLVEATQSELARAMAGLDQVPGSASPSVLRSVKRYEKRLEALGLVQRPERQGYRRILEVVRPTVLPMRPAAPSPIQQAAQDGDISVPDTDCGELKEGDTCVPVDNFEKGTPVSPTGGQSCHQEGDTGVPPSLLQGTRGNQRVRERARGAPDLTANAAETNHDAAAEAAAGQVTRVVGAIGEAREAGRLCEPLDRSGEARLRGLLADRWRAYGDGPETSSSRLALDVGRLLGFALAEGVASPAGYLIGAVARGDWRSTCAPDSEAAAVAAAGPLAERPVEDLGSRGAWMPELVDSPPDATDVNERLTRAQRNLEGVRLPREVVNDLTPRIRRLAKAGVEERQALAAQLELLVIEYGGGFGA